MDVKKLVRDPKRVLACVKEMPGDKLVAVRPVKIQIPARFEEHELAYIGISTFIVGHYAMITEDGFYSPCSVNAMMEITPTSSTRLMVDESEYIEFYFEAGSVIVPNLNLVKRDVLVYTIYSEFLSKGKVPWYYTYDDMGKLLVTANAHAGTNLAESQEVIELVISLIARSPKDRAKYYREFIHDLSDIQNRPAVFIPLKSVQGATNTTNKLTGSYMTDGLISALVNPSDRVERIEGLLRK